MYLSSIIFVAITCPSSMVYQQCGPSCPQTCDTIGDTDCSGGCVEGCFCPNGQLLAYGKCVNKIDCLGKLPALSVCISQYLLYNKSIHV